jgi:glucokinase
MPEIAEPRVAIGIDLGASKTAVALVSEDGSVLERLTARTGAEHGPNAVLQVVTEQVMALRSAASAGTARADGLGVGITGMVDRASGALVAATGSLPNWRGITIAGHLEKVTGIRPVVMNDVHAMAFAEHVLGSSRGNKDVLYVAVGTGIGGAMTHEGGLNLGSHGWAGDIGHIVIDAAQGAPVCPCGRTGHLEAYASGAALAREYGRRADRPVGSDLRPVVELARASDAIARSVLKDGAVVLGRALGGVVNLLDPEMVVFGGGLADIEADLFWRYVVEALGSEVRGPLTVPCEKASFGNDAAVVGAALAALAED